VNPAAEALNQLSGAALDAAFAVHSELGPGLLESTYKACLGYELSKRGVSALAEVPVPVVYDGKKLADVGYRVDLLVENELIVGGGGGACPYRAAAQLSLVVEEAAWAFVELQCRAPAGWNLSAGE